MKKLVLFIIMALLVAVPAFADSIYKSEPSSDTEKAVGKVLETLHERRKANDARGASELYAENAVMKFYWGSSNELNVKEGRLSIYVALSTAAIQKAELYDITVKVINEREAEASGRMKISIQAFGAKFLKEPEVKWQLRVDNGQWRISLEEQSRAMAVRQ